MAIKLRINKNGKPNAGDLKRAKAFIKSNFDKVKKEELPKPLQGYANQIESGKRRGELNKNRLRDTSGRLYSKIKEKAILDAAKDFLKDTGKTDLSPRDILKDNKVKKQLENLAFQNTVSLSAMHDKVIDYLRRNDFKEFEIIDQNGQIIPFDSVNEMILFLQDNQKQLFSRFEKELFQSFNKYSVSQGGEKIQVYTFVYEKDQNESKETILERIKEMEQNGEFGVIGSPPKKGKKPKNGKKTDNKKLNRKGGNK